MTQEADRALLFYAAKAAGIEFNNASLIPMRVDNGMNTLWDPLTDDGDALRLAVKLDISIVRFPACVGTQYPRNNLPIKLIGAAPPWEDISDGQDKYAATRRAIVRAAAEIGKAME